MALYVKYQYYDTADDVLFPITNIMIARVRQMQGNSQRDDLGVLKYADERGRLMTQQMACYCNHKKREPPKRLSLNVAMNRNSYGLTQEYAVQG